MSAADGKHTASERRRAQFPGLEGLTANQAKPPSRQQSTPQPSKTRQRASPQAEQQSKKAETGQAQSQLSGSPLAAHEQGTLAAAAASQKIMGKATAAARALEESFTDAELCSYSGSMEIEADPETSAPADEARTAPLPPRKQAENPPLTRGVSAAQRDATIFPPFPFFCAYAEGVTWLCCDPPSSFTRAKLALPRKAGGQQNSPLISCFPDHPITRSVSRKRVRSPL